MDSPPLGNLAIWLNADRLGLLDAAGVASWPNLGSLGGAFAQAVASMQPILKRAVVKGKAAVHFHGGQLLTASVPMLETFTRTTPWTAAIVMRLMPAVPASAPPNVPLTTFPHSPFSGPGVLPFYFAPPTTTIAIVAGNYAADAIQLAWPAPPIGAWFCWVTGYDGSGAAAGLTARMNGLPQAVQATTGSLAGSPASGQPTTLGAVADLSNNVGVLGDLAELLIWTPALDTLTLEMAEGYLLQRYLSAPLVRQYASPRRPWC